MDWSKEEGGSAVCAEVEWDNETREWLAEEAEEAEEEEGIWEKRSL